MLSMKIVFNTKNNKYFLKLNEQDIEGKYIRMVNLIIQENIGELAHDGVFYKNGTLQSFNLQRIKETRDYLNNILILKNLTGEIDKI